MNFDKANAALDSVYTAETPEALARAYAEWAATYPIFANWGNLRFSNRGNPRF